MDDIAALTSELKEVLVDLREYEDKEDIIFKHIRTAEKLNITVEDFPSNLDWFNTTEPLFRNHLQGKIVVLDFFTYCCINCLHIIPHLRQLEENFSVSDGLVVVGVHSAKFDNEKDSQNILQAVKRYNITHPVVNDKNCYMWNKLNISCWPTIVILGPQRQLIFELIGEGHKEELLLFVKVAMKFYKKSISSHQIPSLPCDQIIISSLLSFPGKIARWKDVFAVSDSGNHRIVIFHEDGCVKFIIGGKCPGFKDGTFTTVQFNSPQGLAFYNSNEIYVADTENHSIRLINLQKLNVTTVVGNGKQGMDYEGGKIGTEQEISSPWDLCIVPSSDLGEVPSQKFPSFAGPPPPSALQPPPPSASHPPPPPPPIPSLGISPINIPTTKVLLIAAAGTHQIWAFFIEGGIWWKGRKYEKNICVAIAGSGKEENRNNRYPKMASFAQPSGLTYSKELKSVFIADSESSSIRKLSLKDGVVSHVVGGAKSPNNLFSYGDVDGRGHEAKLQHPLGVIWSSKEKSVFVCDTYNHKIKKIDPDSSLCKTLENNEFSEPSGGCLNEVEDLLYICDTNNNSIKVLRLEDGRISKLDLQVESNQTVVDTSLKDVWEAEANLNKAGGTLTVRITFNPKEIHGKWSLQLDENKIKAEALNGKLKTNVIEFNLNFNQSDVDDNIVISFDLVLCGDEICSFKKTSLNFHVRRKETGSEFAFIELRWPPQGNATEQIRKCQEEYERGLKMASFCTPEKISNNYGNNYQSESLFQASIGGGSLQIPKETPQYGGFTIPTPLSPLSLLSLPNSYIPKNYPNQLYEKTPSEDKTTFPSFRFMKFRKKVRICSSDPRIPLTLQQLESLSDEILERILTAEGEEIKPRFYGMEIRNDCLITVCGDETTLFWLKKLSRELVHPKVKGLILIEEDEEDKMFDAVGYFEQSQNDSNERILHFIQNQNAGVNVSKWKVVERSFTNTTVQLILLIDFSSAEMLKLKGERINYKYGFARFILKSKLGRRFMEEEVEDEGGDFLTKFPNPQAFSDRKHDMMPVFNEPFQMPVAISNYLEEYKARITKMVEESKNALLRDVNSRNAFIRRKINRKSKRKIRKPTAPT